MLKPKEPKKSIKTVSGFYFSSVMIFDDCFQVPLKYCYLEDETIHSQRVL
jgi:hypothetical protein